VDVALFEELRKLRGALAAKRRIPAFLIFNEVKLRELDRLKPLYRIQLHKISGIGEAKLRSFGKQILKVVEEHCRKLDEREKSE
jgi:ATP-dependent DNA helicase RecQ